MSRFLTIWLRYLKTDWHSLREKALLQKPFVLVSPDHGRMIITASNAKANSLGIYNGMVLADARACIPGILYKDDDPGLGEKLLTRLANWCTRFTPSIAIDLPDTLVLDVSGCAHLWGSEEKYLSTIIERVGQLGFYCHASLSDSIGCSWALSHAGQNTVVERSKQSLALFPLAPHLLRIPVEKSELMRKLGILQVRDLLKIPVPSIRRRFGKEIITRIDQALGRCEEFIDPVVPVEPCQQRLASIELITHATGIEIALETLLEKICAQLKKEEKGLREAVFTCFRVDGRSIQVKIGTDRPTHQPKHLFRLFEEKIKLIEPGFGIEVFLLEARKVENIIPLQEKIWGTKSESSQAIAELLDRISGKWGEETIHRYIPVEHYWPERSFAPARTWDETTTTRWVTNRPRPFHLLEKPDPIEVTAPIPDYPPMNFRYRGKLHNVTRADGPERIAQEWWITEGLHRDYYQVEDEEGKRYWLFRSGHYKTQGNSQWFIHGFFA